MCTMKCSGEILGVDIMFKVIDLETTGLKNYSEIAQLSIWALDDKLNPVSRSNYFFSIHEEMPKEAYRVNRLSKADLATLSCGYYFEDRKEDILGELEGHILVAHNASFERRMLSYHLSGALDESEWICTMRRYTPTLALRDRAGNNGYKMCNLRELTDYVLRVINKTQDDLCEMYSRASGVDINDVRFHDALFDTYCTALAFHVLG